MRVRSPIDALRNSAPVSYVSKRRQGSWSTPAGLYTGGTEAELAAMDAAGTLHAIVTLTSQSTAQVEWTLYRKAASGQPEDREPVDRHPAIEVWSNPNDDYTQREYIETFQQHLDLTGKCFWIAAYNERFRKLGPVELWPVRPDTIKPRKGTKNFIEGWTYTDPDGDKVPLGKDEVIPLRFPSPLDLYESTSPVSAILANLYAYRNANEYNNVFFRNGAEPGGILQVNENESIDDDDIEDWKEQFGENHKGVHNAHRVAWLQKAKWVDRRYTNKDMEFVNLLNLSRDTIREAFRIHKHMLGQSDDVNRANATAADPTFARYQTVPRLDRIKDALNFRLMPLFEGKQGARKYEWDYANPVPPDAESIDRERNSKADAYSTLVTAGVHPDDAAERVGWAPMRHVQRQEAAA